MKSYVLKGNICYSKSMTELKTISKGFIVCVDGVSKGAFSELPNEYGHLPITDHGDKVIIPGLTDTHLHAPQFTFRSLGMDLELIDWLNTHAFPEEAKYSDINYAEKAYDQFIKEIIHTPNTRFIMFATRHIEATTILMDKMETSGHVSFVGKVNMDRNSHPDLQEENAETSVKDTIKWLENIKGRYSKTKPILTPRFIPSCTDELMSKLSELSKEHKLPVQSHLSENQGEIEWVKELVPDSKFYGDAYNNFGLFGENAKTIMAHCVWSSDDEIELMKNNNVYMAHCPLSNIHLSSGIAPVRKFLNAGVSVGLGTDIAGGSKTSILSTIAETVQVSKLYWRHVDQTMSPLTIEEAFYLGTIGGGSFFGKVGSFEEGYEFDAVVLDDSSILPQVSDLTVIDRLTRLIYLSDDRHVVSKYVRGSKIL